MLHIYLGCNVVLSEIYAFRTLQGLGPYLKHFLYNVNCTDIFV